MIYVYLLNWTGSATEQIQALWKVGHAHNRWPRKPAHVSNSLYALPFLLSTLSKTSTCATEQLTQLKTYLDLIWGGDCCLWTLTFSILMQATSQNSPGISFWKEITYTFLDLDVPEDSQHCFLVSLPDWRAVVCCGGNISYLCIPP